MQEVNTRGSWLVAEDIKGLTLQHSMHCSAAPEVPADTAIFHGEEQACKHTAGCVLSQLELACPVHSWLCCAASAGLRSASGQQLPRNPSAPAGRWW